ncbi:S8 family peptidase [Domibacillus sp. PGB-M46]|uniref:S8 family peptidase n=1 Tax=Domibacillus sp. PGB-M46 TaxID=2910255 RepID=UPI001F56B18E|nr:S8 family peptidase [Domibacillus sp. PGB-M46]MCI2253081.1 S8 family peptidase [Domibacillus sp. PGB-M46]
MKKAAASLLATGLLFASFGPNAAFAAQEEEQNVIVIFDEKVDKKAIAQAEGEIDQTFKQLPIASVTLPADEVKELKQDKDVVRVEKDITVHASADTLDWGIGATNVPVSWNAGFTGRGVKIAVVDTGVAAHPDLAVAGGASFVSYTTSYQDDNGHGTHVAGIIGAESNGFGTKGVAPDADVYAVKSLEKSGSGSLSSILAGIDWAITNKMDIINLSLGTQTNSAAFQALVDKAYASGILVVAAAGNDGSASGTDDTVDYPARYDSAIAVGAVDSSLKRTSFSSTGSTVEIAAPGQSIVSTYLNNGYARMSGTSMAAPYVSGELALLKQANPTADAVRLRTILKDTSKDLGTAGRDSWFGYGFMQAPASAAPQAAQTAPAVSTVVSSLTASTTFIAGKPQDTKAVQLTAVRADGSKVDITEAAQWKTANSKVATVNRGIITIQNYGKTTVSGLYGGKTVNITVDASVRSLSVSTKRVAGKPGTVQKVAVTALLSSGQRADVTPLVTWKVLNQKVANVSGGVVSISQYGRTYAAPSFMGKTVNILIESKK